MKTIPPNHNSLFAGTGVLVDINKDTFMTWDDWMLYHKRVAFRQKFMDALWKYQHIYDSVTRQLNTLLTKHPVDVKEENNIYTWEIKGTKHEDNSKSSST